jgi:hypothetical protein
MAIKRVSEFSNFDRMMHQLVKVSHDDLKAKLDAEKKAKKKPSKKRASVRVSGGKG